MFNMVENVATGRVLCLTDIQIALPMGCYGRVAARSGLAIKHGIDVGAGVIDADFCGNIGVVLFNHDKVDYKVGFCLCVCFAVFVKTN